MYKIVLVLTFISISLLGDSQVRVKSLDPEIMKDKVLYINEYNPDDPVIARWVRKGKDSKLSAAQEYASLWRTVMEESSWDATPYEIKSFDKKKMIKSKNPQALLLTLYSKTTQCGNNGYVYNYYASVIMTGPKKKVIATALINDLEWWDRGDLRLIVNMLSNSLNEAIDVYDEENGSKFSAARAGQKQVLVDFMENAGDKTFLVVRSAMRDEQLQDLLNDSNTKAGKKKRIQKRHDRAVGKDDDIELALSNSWRLCDYKMVYTDELMEFRDALSPDHFFWINIEINTCSPLSFGANRNHLFSTDGDKVLAAFAGKGKMKPATIDNIQKKLANRHERFKKQLAKK